MELMLLWSCAQPASDGGHSETELAEPLGLTSGQWSAALYDLRDRGLLSFQRIPDGDERRPLMITPLGHAALEDVSRALTPMAVVWNSEVGESELRECVQLLRRLSDISSSSRLERGVGGAPVHPPRWTRLHRGAA
jgi:DNA-binding MarR family transcriptional regulator